MAWSLAQWQKAALVALILGSLFGYWVAGGEATTLVGDWIKQEIGPRLDLLKLLFTQFGAAEQFGVMTAALLGEYLPLTASAIAALILYGLRKKLLYPVIEYLWPGFPSILQAALVTPGADPLLPSSDKTPAFVGRVEEIRMLRRFVGENTEKRPRFFLLTGPEGIGKTRLVLAYLATFNKRDWDVGRLDLTLGAEAVQKARFRRKTAILLDDPAESGQLTALLAALAAHRQRLVVFVTMASGGLDLPVQQHHALAGLEAADLRAIAPGLSPLAETRAEGRPLFALLGENPLQALRKRAKDRLGRLDGNPGAARVLLLAALAGPLPHSDRKKLTPGDLSIPALQPLFGDLPPEAFRTQLPALTPTTMAAALLLAVLGRYPDGEFDDLLTQIAATYPEAMAQRLGLLWQWADLTPTESAHRDAVQKIFDAAATAWVDAAHAAARAAFERTTTEPTTPAKWRAFTHTLARLAAAAAQRPFDGEIRAAEASSAVNAINFYGAKGDFAGLERWGTRLIALAEHPIWGQAVAIRDQEATGTVNAMLHYGVARDFAGLERWGTRLIALVEHPVWGQAVAIREEEAKSAVNTIGHYGAAQDFVGLERWGARLIALVEHPAWGQAVAIREWEAMGTVNAMLHYGAAQDFAGLERWGARLIALAEQPTWGRVVAIRDQEARGAVTAIFAYGKVQDTSGLERWAARLITLTEHPTWGRVVKIREWEAWGAVNAIAHYGKVQDFVGLERWGARLIALAEHPTRGQALAIREWEAWGAVNAINFYGAARDFAGLKRWGERLIALAKHPTWGQVAAIRGEEAKGAVNAMAHYGAARDFAGLECWGARLIALTEHPTWSEIVVIREAEANGAASAIKHGHQTAFWRQRLAAVARRFPENLTIQDVANGFNLTYAAQCAQGWPFGPPPDAKAPAADETKPAD